MKPQKVLVFDFDGTLLDSFQAHYKAYETMFARFGIRVTPEAMMACHSPDWHQVYRAMELPEEKWALADTYWLEAAASQEPPLFPGAAEVLAELSACCPLGLVTAGSKSRVQRDLRRTGIGAFFQVVVTGDDVAKAKPSPEGLLKALDALGAFPDAAVYIGDTDVDAETAHAAGVQFVGVTGDYSTVAAGNGYPCIGSVVDLPDLLKLG